MASLRRTREFVTWRQCVQRPNIAVDSYPNAGSVLTLSHWPSAPTIAGVHGDTSTDLVASYLGTNVGQPDVDIVTSSHFDVDSMASLFLLTHASIGDAMVHALRDAAFSNDFLRFTSLKSLKIASALDALTEPARALYQAAIGDASIGDRQAAMINDVIAEMPRVIESVEDYETLWSDAVQTFTRSRESLQRTVTCVQEHDHVDLAAFTLSEEPRRGSLGLPYWGLAPMAFHERSSASTLLLRSPGRHYQVNMRYESWVRFESRKIYERRDLGGLLAYLNNRDGDGDWLFDGVQQMMPCLRNRKASSIAPDSFSNLIIQFLENAPAAWRPGAYSRVLTWIERPNPHSA
ncbi:MAG: hypothetical protein HC869_01205 [Rhodospirillales bacterium]|nr:hypothetical protein [Rhodospirillales bacterium]